MSAKIHAATEAKLVEGLVEKLHFTRTLDPSSGDAASQHGWYNGFVSALYTIYGDAIAERVSQAACDRYIADLATQETAARQEVLTNGKWVAGTTY